MTSHEGPGPSGGGFGAAQAAALPITGSSDRAIAPLPVATVAFVGRTLKGPVNEPIAIGDFTQFQQRFGGLWSESLLPHAVEQFFEHGGRQALIVRVTSDGLAPSIDLPAGSGRLTLTGLCPGSQEFLRASVDHDGISAQDADLFNLVVQRVRVRGSELVEAQEIHRRVSILPGSARDVARKLAASQLVRVEGPLPKSRPDITRGDDSRALIGYVDCNGDGDDGEVLSDYDLIGSESRRTGLFALKDGPPFNFLYMPPPARDRDLGMSALVVGTRFCRRHHAMLLVDPPCCWNSVQRAHDGLRDWHYHSADALMFFPRLRTLDRLLGRTAEFPPSAGAIGALLREESSGGVHESRESPLLRPSAAPSLWVDRIQRARLAQRGVNTLRATRTPARDAIPACTLAGEHGQGPDARQLAPRRMALQIRASIEHGTRWVSIEGNTPRSRERVCRQVEAFLQQFARDGAFAGADRNRHYFVICDERLNGPLQQASGVFRLVYGYQARHAPTRTSWLVEHGPGASRTRAVSLNQLAAFELEVG